VTSHFSSEFYINALRFLLEGYKVARDRFKDKKTPEHVEDIVVKAEKSQSPASADIERGIDRLEPGDAAIVKADLQLMSLLTLPAPTLDSFDYWGKLTQLVNGLQIYARNNRLFELRGQKVRRFGEFLSLPRTSKVILPREHAREMAIPSRSERVKRVESSALLRKEGAEFPIVVFVGVEFDQFSSMGDSWQAGDAEYFMIEPGQQRHWLRFVRDNGHQPHFEPSYEYRLEASDFIDIAQALNNDIREYATEVNADERKIEPLFTAIDAFTKGLRTGS
jgi:hypothetical protein